VNRLQRRRLFWTNGFGSVRDHGLHLSLQFRGIHDPYHARHNLAFAIQDHRGRQGVADSQFLHFLRGCASPDRVVHLHLALKAYKLVAPRQVIGSRADQIAQQKELTKQRAENTLLVYLSVDKSRKIPLGEVEFPADWVEKTKKRSKQVNITEKEQAILKALNTVISVDFDKSGFQGVIDFLEKKTGQSIIIDKQAMNEANVTYDTPVTMKAKTTTRTILKRVLADLNLAYIIKDEAIQVTSIQKAKETLSARTYYVGDLVGFGGGMGFGGYIGRQQMALQIQQLATLITQVVEPESWAVNGGSGLGTIAFEPITMSFVVRQTAEIHYLLGIGLR